MSDLSRHRPYLAWGAILVGVTVVVVLALVPPGTWLAFDQRRSSLRTSPDGVAAWSQSLERLGVTVETRLRSLADEAPRGAALVLLEPVMAPTPAEAHAVLEWVRSGGSLVYAPSSPALILDSLGIGLTLRLIDPYRDPPEQDFLAPHRWGATDVSSRAISMWALEADSEATSRRWEPLALTGDRRLPTVVWLPVGAGGAVVLADAVELANGSLESSAAAVAVTRAVADRAAGGDTVFFSEFHQALDGRRGLLREALAIAVASVPGRGVIYLALAGLAVALLAGRRFGSPTPEPEGVRRSTLEHLEALAEIYRAAGAHGTVVRHLIRGAARRMGQAIGPSSELETLVAWGARPHLTAAATAAADALRSAPPDLPELERALDALVARHASHLGA